MCKRNNSSLFFLCSLIEQLGRDLLLDRGQVVEQLGADRLRALFDHADVLHCEPIEKVSDDVTREFGLTEGDFDNVAAARYGVPDTWTMGKVYARLIEDLSEENTVLQTLAAVFASPLMERLCDLNAAFYYQSREYLAECFRRGEVIDA